MSFRPQQFALTAILAAILVAGPARAADDNDDSQYLYPFIDRERHELIERLLRDGFSDLAEAMNELIDALPRYELPEITPDGDIIIRRKRSEDGNVQSLSGTDEASI